jgi:hypothetical protein
MFESKNSLRNRHSALVKLCIASVGFAALAASMSPASAETRRPRPTTKPPVTQPPATTQPPTSAATTSTIPAVYGYFEFATYVGQCTIPSFTSGVTNWLDFAKAANAAGCKIRFDGNGSGTPAGTLTGRFSAFAGPPDTEGLYPPSAYLPSGSITAGQVLPAGSELYASVNGVNISRAPRG